MEYWANRAVLPRKTNRVGQSMARRLRSNYEPPSRRLHQHWFSLRISISIRHRQLQVAVSLRLPIFFNLYRQTVGSHRTTNVLLKVGV